MTKGKHVFIVSIGYVTLFFSGVFLILFFVNLRSRLYYNGPNYGFLFWIALYSAITGFGLVRLKKWAVLSLFVPGIVDSVILAFAVGASKTTFPTLAVLFNIALLGLLVAIPARMFRHWAELRW
jgi:hypothetical protein